MTEQGLSDQIGELQKAMIAGFEAVGARFDKVDARLDCMNTRLEHVETAVALNTKAIGDALRRLDNHDEQLLGV